MTASSGDNPVLCEVVRGGEVESVHRGRWVVADAAGKVLAGDGDWAEPTFVRSSIKSLQAVALIDSGAADAHGVSTEEIATACASHLAEPDHLRVIGAWLKRLDLDDSHLGCGPQPREHLPGESRNVLNNCSGKHTGMLTVAVHLGADPADYLDPTSPVQKMVAEAISEASRTPPSAIGWGIDGCSAPTPRLPLDRFATGIANVRPRIREAAVAHPYLVGGHSGRVDSALMAATDGRLFAKVGAEAVLTVQSSEHDTALVIKTDDGAYRATDHFAVDWLTRNDWITAGERAQLAEYAEPTIVNFAGNTTGTLRFPH